MKAALTTLKLATLTGSVLLSATFLSGQDWQVIDTFEGGQPQATWTTTASPTLETGGGYLKTGQAPGSNTTASMRVALPQSFSSGQFTLSFDFYLPNGPDILEHQVGFGVGSEEQVLNGSWGAAGNRNRFQTIGPAPQKLGNAYDWGVPEDPDYGTAKPDALGTTERGVVYNIWLVYNLDEANKGVTIYSKKATDSMDARHSEFFAFDDAADDDWSTVEYFAIAQGLMSSPPEGYVNSDVLGGIFDNIYLSAGENLTLNPSAFRGEWDKIDTFSGGTPDATWAVDTEVTLSFENDELFLTSSLANAAASVPLPIGIVGGATTVYMEILFPSGGLNNAMFAVVSDEQLAQTGAARFGNNDRLLTFGASAPQSLTKWTAWTEDFLGDTQQDQWYHLWLVYDHDAGSVEVYSVPKPESGEATLPTEPAGSFDLATEYAALKQFIVGCWNVPTTGIKLDNLYQTFGKNISLPPIEPSFTPGWQLTDIGWVYMYTQEWGYSIFMGFVYLPAMPYIYQSEWGWFYMAGSFPADPSGTNFWMYNQTLGYIFAPDTYGGFFWIMNSGEWNSFLNPTE